MTVYVVAQIRIHDRALYDSYAARFMPILIQYGGRLLAADEAPAVLEGEWARRKLNIIGFPDEASARRWMESEEYRAIAADRLASSDGVVLLVQGFGKA
ncbi:MAG TPA: DUF1330 domain-containing protein [Allosphingosinicella sp.]|jgi:uncharacterized protein (DUF1330 family)|nr:DUF1330 domain-containing protein [Allosphingosinicella sp.]